METFVLVHGAWGGGFQWREVAKLLRSAGHEVYTPTLTGLGERKHLAHPGIGFFTHVEDILGVLEYEDLNDVVLVGHSYGGAVITGVAEKADKRLKQLVYLDAFVPYDGESIFKIIGTKFTEYFLENARINGDGWRTVYNPPMPKMEPTPILTAMQTIDVKNSNALLLKHTYIYCTDHPSDWPFTSIINQAMLRAKDAGWPIREIDGGGHWPMISNPKKVVDVLLEIC